MAATRHCSRSSRAFQSTCAPTAARQITLPAFLVPAFSRSQRSGFCTTRQCRSKIGSAPLSLPEEVKFTVHERAELKDREKKSRLETSGATVDIEGPLGKMSMAIPPYLSIDANEQARTRTLRIEDAEDKGQKSMWGTVRAHLQNHIVGVTEGHSAILRMVGVGYRAMIEDKAVTKVPEYEGQKFVSLKVGYSHPIELGVPRGVKVSTPQPTRILLEGVEKEVVMQFAAKIRAWRKPEPYKGKGIFVNGETIRMKAKKIK